MSSATAWAYSREMLSHTRLKEKGYAQWLSMAIRRPTEVWRVGAASHQKLPTQKEARVPYNASLWYIFLPQERIFGEFLLIIKYYIFNYGIFSGSCVLQGNAFGEASGSCLFLPACCKLHIGARRAQSENLMNSLRLCAEWHHTFFLRLSENIKVCQIRCKTQVGELCVYALNASLEQ